ncbi:MAG TPA: ketopantoate reductase family protein [Thermoplasmata archaeon]|nr:ketopantoate reductase family protein [Thermoplasmata archaeon]
MRVVVFGAGAVGSLFGAYLDRAGHSVLLIGTPEHVTAVRANGLRVTGRLEGTFRVDAAAELRPGPAPDAVLLTVKTFDLERAATALGRAVRPGTPILLPQNGLGVEEVARRRLAAEGWTEPEGSLVRAVNSVPATWVGPGEVRAAGDGEVLLPEARGSAAEAVARFDQLLRDAGIRVRAVESIEREVWRKAVVNAAINPVTAVHGVVNGRLLDAPYRAEAEELLLEAARTARAAGVDVTDAEARADLDRIVRATAENRSSMLQDLERGRPTEVDAISGEILRAARLHGIDLPRTEAAIASVRARTEGATGTRAERS